MLTAAPCYQAISFVKSHISVIIFIYIDASYIRKSVYAVTVYKIYI